MKKIAAIQLIASLFFVCGGAAYAAEPKSVERIVNELIPPLMAENSIPGMAVAVSIEGQRYFFNFGEASKESGQKVTEKTLFEIGSISKAFTATLAAYAQETGHLSLADQAGVYLPELRGSHLERVSLLDLGTYAAGGLPLQFPPEVDNEAKMTAYFQAWRPSYAAGSHRLYSNPSIGLFGYLAARSLGAPFDELMEGTLLPGLGLADTYIRVPEERMGDYAWGYSKEGRPVRVKPGVLDSEAYGIKTNSSDLLSYLEANMGEAILAAELQAALETTHSGYFKVGGMTQGLGWESYDYPVSLETLLAGNSGQIMLQANELSRFDPPLPPRSRALYNKTGSTNGFGAYVAFVPDRKIGLVLLANKNYPNADRIKVLHQILSALDQQQ
jgi:Beta-lactamase class C and other penicillin binding proteins